MKNPLATVSDFLRSVRESGVVDIAVVLFVGILFIPIYKYLRGDKL